jgi:hypothetical protein
MRGVVAKMGRCCYAPLCGCCPILGQGPLRGLTLNQYTASLCDGLLSYGSLNHSHLALKRCVELWGPETER